METSPVSILSYNHIGHVDSEKWPEQTSFTSESLFLGPHGVRALYFQRHWAAPWGEPCCLHIMALKLGEWLHMCPLEQCTVVTKKIQKVCPPACKTWMLPCLMPRNKLFSVQLVLSDQGLERFRCSWAEILALHCLGAKVLLLTYLPPLPSSNSLKLGEAQMCWGLKQSWRGKSLPRSEMAQQIVGRVIRLDDSLQAAESQVLVFSERFGIWDSCWIRHQST